jgi:diguanylate cyclase
MGDSSFKIYSIGVTVAEKTSFDTARETIRLLTQRKLPPTPMNYQRIYNEILGLPIEPPFPLERMRDIAMSLPAKTPGQIKNKSLLESAVNQLNWDGVKNAILGYGGFTPVSGSTQAAALARSAPAVVATAAAPEPLPLRAAALTAEFFAALARLIEHALPAFGKEDDRFLEETKRLLQALRQAEPDAVAIKQMLQQYNQRVLFAAEDQAEIKAMLLQLLQLIIDNIAYLTLDDTWLKGQVDALASACVPPLTLRRLDDVAQKLKDVILKQTEAKARTMRAQEEMRLMLATFVDRLASMAESTGEFQTQLEGSARLIEQAKSLDDIAPVLKEVVSATHVMATQTQDSRDQLQGLRQRAQATEAELQKLHQELDRVSAQARHDPLTGALNRQGLDEAINREVAQMRRKDSSLCVALLDIDNFKKLNDSLGHAAGDAALAHLASVTREVMRLQDTLARYGGEEFVVLLPDTALEHGIDAMTRLQRELTRRFFLSGTEKVLITFSAGVAQVLPDEEGADAIKRADQAMYLAKRAGKNRVLGA